MFLRGTILDMLAVCYYIHGDQQFEPHALPAVVCVMHCPYAIAGQYEMQQ